jgi:hypothetical protein
MSSEADQAAAAKRVADEAAAAAASEAAAAAASANWPTGGYYMLIPLLLISMCIVLAISVDVSTICLVLHSYMIKYQYVHVMLMFYSWINIIEKLPRFLTPPSPPFPSPLPKKIVGKPCVCVSDGEAPPCNFSWLEIR